MSTDGGAVIGIGIGTDTLSSGSAPSSAPGSPKNRPVKFLCSHGGKILPRPSDAHLKYVGGETRVISVPKDIPFQELMKKLTYLIDGEMILKYQVISEDLDALVSVKSDEDLRHMFDEIDRYESARAPKLRAFLFPSSPIVLENQTGTLDPHALEQRYIDAVNGVVRSSTFSIKQHPTLNTVQNGSLVSSACSSPRSPDSCTTETINNEAMLQSNYQNSRLNMHKVQSLPSICSLNAPQQNSHHVHQLPPQYYRQAHQSGYQSPKPPVDLHKSVAPERLTSVRSVGRAEGVRYQVDPATHYYYPASRHYEDCSHCLDRRMVERTGGLAISPVHSSPLHGHSVMRAWDRTMGGDM